jgi:hypothetical protein
LRPARSAGYASIVAHIWIAFGHEDLVDHDDLRRDPTMAVLADKLSAHRWLARARSTGSSAVRARRRAIPGAQARQWVVDPEGQVMAQPGRAGHRPPGPGAHLPNLLAKKSRSTVNCPILACSFSISRSCAASANPPTARQRPHRTAASVGVTRWTPLHLNSMGYPRKSGSQRTLRWREQDSNPGSPIKRDKAF